MQVVIHNNVTKTESAISAIPNDERIATMRYPWRMVWQNANPENEGAAVQLKVIRVRE